jgi:hypothetical protein
MEDTRDLNILNEVFQFQRSVESALRADSVLLRRYLDDRDNLISRSVEDAVIESQDRENHATCTAFCLYYLAKANLIVNFEVPESLAILSKSEAEKTVQALGDAIVIGHSAEPSSGRPHESSQVPATAPLPNQYNSSIQVAGYLAASRLLKIDIPENVLLSCELVVDYLLNLVKEHRGYVPRIGPPSTTPSPYLTFWAGTVFEEWSSSNEARRTDVEEAKRELASSSALELSNSIAYHYAGLASRFDVIELAYSALTTLRFNKSPESRQTAVHGVSLLLDNYFSDGCFSPSTPVFADQRNFSLLVPTAEFLALLLLPSRRKFFLNRSREFYNVFEWLRIHRNEDGWYSEHDVRYGKPTAFMTASALVFFSCLVNLLDDVLSEGAAKELSVGPYAPTPDLDKINYPGRLAQIIQSNVIEPIKRRNPKLASYSMILYGPPGTSKTTVARKLAHDLKWPLLILNQSDFLSKGINNIDAEADRIFRLAYYLKDVVILFDEVEELIVDRTAAEDKLSRLLTTSMLPRIHSLRDKSKVVFIFATNHVEVIDRAASRLGRFDIIHCVMPPTQLERELMLISILKEFSAGDDVKDIFGRLSVSIRTENFGYMDLKALVRRVMTATEIENKALNESLVSEAIEVGKKTVKEASLEKFKESQGKFDRP